VPQKMMGILYWLKLKNVDQMHSNEMMNQEKIVRLVDLDLFVVEVFDQLDDLEYLNFSCKNRSIKTLNNFLFI
jgi:hypothetical protein